MSVTELDANDVERRPRLSLHWRIGAPIAIALVVVGVAVLASRNTRALPAGSFVVSAQRMQSLLARLPQHGAVLGDPHAPVSVIEFADLQCPFCDGFALGLLPGLIDRYVARGEVKLVFESLPVLGHDSEVAARAALAAAAQNRLWQFVDMFFFHQRPERSGYVSDGFIRTVASQVSGLNVGRLMRDRESPRVAEELAAGIRRARDRKVRNTPTFLIVRGARELRVVGVKSLNAQIDELLGR